MSDSVQPHPRDSPGKNTGVGCHFLLQCIKVKNESEVAQSCPTLSWTDVIYIYFINLNQMAEITNLLLIIKYSWLK